jgi:uncharacterized membrane protein YbhN (UPF0104 family)
MKSAYEVARDFPIRRMSAVVVSALLLAFALWVSGIENVLHGLAGFPAWAVAGMLTLLSANLLMVSFRFWRVLAHFGIALPWPAALRANIAGNVGGFFVLSLLGHVMGRQLVLQRFGVSPVVNSSLTAYERTLLALVSGVLGTMGAVYLFGQSVVAGFFGQIALTQIVIAACGGWALSLWLGRSRFESKLSGRVFSRDNYMRVLTIVGLTLAGQVLMLGCFVLAILAVSQGIPVPSVFAASAVISLAASIPITVGGWGVREVAAVYVLGHLGVAAADALTMSVVTGLCVTLVTLVAAPFSFRKVCHA